MPDDLAGFAAELVDELEDIRQEQERIKHELDHLIDHSACDCGLVDLPTTIPSHLQAQDDDDARAVPRAIARYR